MSRYSPTVLEQPFNLGGILDEMLQGYDTGRRQKRGTLSRKRRERIEDEDRAWRERRERAEALGRPGASTLRGHFDDPNAIPLTQETLRTVGRTDTNRVPLDFERPEPRSLADSIPGYVPEANLPTPEPMAGQGPGAERKPGEYMFQDATPYMIAPGVVMDPRRAREQRMQEAMLGHHLNQYLAGPQPWKPMTREEKIDFGRDTAAAGVEGRRLTPEQFDVDVDRRRRLNRAGAQGTAEGTPERKPPRPTSTAAANTVAQMYGTWDPEDEVYTYSFSEEQRRKLVEQISGQPLPPMPLPVAEPIFARIRRAQPPGRPTGLAAPRDTLRLGGRPTRTPAPSSAAQPRSEQGAQADSTLVVDVVKTLQDSGVLENLTTEEIRKLLQGLTDEDGNPVNFGKELIEQILARTQR